MGNIFGAVELGHLQWRLCTAGLRCERMLGSLMCCVFRAKDIWVGGLHFCLTGHYDSDTLSVITLGSLGVCGATPKALLSSPSERKTWTSNTCAQTTNACHHTAAQDNQGPWVRMLKLCALQLKVHTKLHSRIFLGEWAILLDEFVAYRG